MFSKIQFNLSEESSWSSASFKEDESFVKIGHAFQGKAKANELIRIFNSRDAFYYFGDSSLARSLEMHFALGGKDVYALSPFNSIKGELDLPLFIKPYENFNYQEGYLAIKNNFVERQITRSKRICKWKEGSKSFMDREWIIRISKPGLLDTAEYQISKDLGKSWSSSQIMKQDLPIDESATLSFQYIHFRTNDSFFIKTTRDNYSFDDLMKSFESLFEIPHFRFLHYVDPIENLENINRLDEKIRSMRKKKIWFRALIQYPQRKEENFQDYQAKLLNWIQAFSSPFLMVSVQYVQSTFLNSNQWVAAADYLLATLSRSEIYESPGWIGKYIQKDIRNIQDRLLFRDILNTLDDHGISYLYFEEGPYVDDYPSFNVGLLKNSKASQLRTISMGRIMDKALSLVYRAVLPYLRSNEEISQKKSGLLALRVRMENALEQLRLEGAISDFKIQFPQLSEKSGEVESSFQISPVSHMQSLNFQVSFLEKKKTRT